LNQAKKALTLFRRLKKKLTQPKVMRRLNSGGTASPRLKVETTESANIKPVIYKVNGSSGQEQLQSHLESLFKSHYHRLIAGRSVLVKFNLNTAEPYPASVSPQMLRLVVDILLSLGAKEVTAGDCCTISLLPTKNQVKKAGLSEAVAGRAKIICFDDMPWVTVPIKGHYLKSVTVPRAAIEAETIIALANLKTHCQAGYTGALKLSVGFMHPLERRPLHRDHLQEKIAEINLAIQPDLYIVDARKAMITGGPDHGTIVPADTILVGENPLALDLEGYRLLYSLKVANDCLEGYREDPLSLAQLRHARDIGIGGSSWSGYNLESWPSK
jgi:uncharacterized protein (DUF362 family)